MKKIISKKEKIIYIAIFVISLLFLTFFAINLFSPELFRTGDFICKNHALLGSGPEEWHCGWTDYLKNYLGGIITGLAMYTFYGLPYLLPISGILLFIWVLFRIYKPKNNQTNTKNRLLLKTFLVVLYFFVGSFSIGLARAYWNEQHSTRQTTERQIKQIVEYKPTTKQSEEKQIKETTVYTTTTTPGIYTNEKYGFTLNYSSSRCFLDQERASDFYNTVLYLEIYKEGECPTMKERGGLGTLTFKYSYDLIEVIKSSLSAKEYLKEKFANIKTKTQETVRINNIDWEIIKIDRERINAERKEGEPPYMGNDTIYATKNNKNGFIYLVDWVFEDLTKEWTNL